MLVRVVELNAIGVWSIAPLWGSKGREVGCMKLEVRRSPCGPCDRLRSESARPLLAPPDRAQLSRTRVRGYARIRTRTRSVTGGMAVFSPK